MAENGKQGKKRKQKIENRLRAVSSVFLQWDATEQSDAEPRESREFAPGWLVSDDF